MIKIAESSNGRANEGSEEFDLDFVRGITLRPARSALGGPVLKMRDSFAILRPNSYNLADLVPKIWIL